MTGIFSRFAERGGTVATVGLLGAGVMAVASWGAMALAGTGDRIKLAPHRAVYEITLVRGGAGIARLTGRMVYEVTGSACEGYEQNMRFVTRAVSPEGIASVSDMRAASWEEGNGRTFKFSSSQYQDEKLLERVAGGAIRNSRKGKIKIDIKQPKKLGLDIPANAYFPIQHSIALLKAAKQGSPVFTVDLYDGTEKGQKVYRTTSIIGNVLPAAADAALPRVKNAEDLAKMRAWPISISYFEKSKARVDAVPVYELAFRFYENGVSRKLYIDYGSFAVRGALSKLTYFKPTDCAHDTGAKPKQ